MIRILKRVWCFFFNHKEKSFYFTAKHGFWSYCKRCGKIVTL